MTDPDTAPLLDMTAGLVAAYVTRNAVRTADMPALIASVHATLSGLGQAPGPGAAAETLRPAVPIRKSITEDYIVCLDDGKRFASLKRHLSKLGMTPAEYRAKWGLPSDYPMVAPAYAAKRSELAKRLGLGNSRRKG